MSNAIKELFVPYQICRHLSGAMSYLVDVDNDNTLLTSMKKCGDVLRSVLNPHILNDIKDFKNSYTQDILIIRGFPLDPVIPPTPYYGKQSLQSIPLAVAVNLGLYDLLNINPVTYWGENDGHLFRHVIPNKNSIHEKSSHGSMHTLGMHVDNCHLPLIPEMKREGFSACPEYLSLFGVRCDLKVFTKIAILKEAIKLLDSETIEELKKPNYILKMPDSFASAKQYELPILVQDNHLVYHGRFDKEYTFPKNSTAQQAFEQLGQALLSKQAMHQFLLLAGDFLIFKNQRVTHSRENFMPRFDGADRWLLRLFGMSDLSRTVPIDKNKPYCIAA